MKKLICPAIANFYYFEPLLLKPLITTRGTKFIYRRKLPEDHLYPVIRERGGERK